MCQLLVGSRRHTPVLPAGGLGSTPVCSVYVGRPSVLGNPFSVQQYGREGAVARYRVWLWRRMRAGGPQLAALRGVVALLQQGVTVQLMCWCSPELCHAEVVADAVQWLRWGGRV